MPRNLEIETEQFLEDIEQLLYSSDFKELESRLKSEDANIWHILGITRKEVLITKFLGWLLNSQEQHNIGSQFLEELITEALKNNNNKHTELSLIRLRLMDLSEVEVKTESQLSKNSRADIIISDSKEGLLCIIENKIGAKEGERQTNKYYKHSFEVFPRENYPYRIYIYLSPNKNDEPESKHFSSLSYQNILNVILRLKQNKKLSEKENFLLDQFDENIRRSIIVDAETKDLIREIYDAYGPVIDFIYENAQSSQTSKSDAIWDGKTWFLNTGEKEGKPSYSWEDYRKFHFVCAGGGKRFRDIMKGFKVGDIIYSYLSKYGYVGVGRITKLAVPFRKAVLDDGRSLLELYQNGKLYGTYDSSSDKENCDWIALISWINTVKKNNAIELTPIVPATAARIYNHRKKLIEKINQGLGIKSID